MSSTSALERLNDSPVAKPFVAIGNGVIRFLTELGLVCQFFATAVALAFRPPYRINLLLTQMEFVGVGSLFIIMLTGTFTGAVFTLQTVNGLAQFNLESVVGTTVMIGVTRELAPVLTALMVTGRVASAMATELGTMRVTEQIDAMEVMAVNPVQYLATPRIVAAAIMVPCLSMLFVSVAYAGAYIMAVPVMGIDEGAYIARIKEYVQPFDVLHGFYKSIVLGILLATVGCYKGYNAAGGARGVGTATTQAVVISSISVFIIDYVLSAMLMKFEPAYNAVSQ